MNSGRFDTCLPALAMDIADDLERDQDRPLTVAERNQIAPLVEKAMAGCAADKNQPPNITNWANSTRIVWFYLTKQYDRARKLLDTMPAIENGPATYKGIEGGEIIGHIYAMTSAEAPAIRTVMKVSDAAARLKGLKQIAANLPEVDEAAAKSIQPLRGKSASNWLKRRIKEAEFEASLAGGKWTPLPIAPDLEGWMTHRGTWKADGTGAIIGTSDNGLTIVSPFQLPDTFEFRCTVEAVDVVDPHLKAVSVFPAWSPSKPTGAFLNLPEGQGQITRYWSYGKFPLEREGDRTTVHLRFEKGMVSAPR